MEWNFLWNILWVALPFIIVARVLSPGKPKQESSFDPLKWAVICGLFFTALFWGMFCIPFVSSKIWEIRRTWWTCIGAMPSTIWAVAASILFGALFATLNRKSYGRIRWLSAAPLAVWLACSTPQSELVEMSRFRKPEWRDGVCLQSTGFTCTPSAAATLLNVYGIEATESEMAVRCATSSSGTHVLGLARGLASKFPAGKFTVRACRLTPDEVRRVSLPCITFTCNHAWVIFRIDYDGGMEIGEALGGRHYVAWSDFSRRFCGEAVVVTPNDESNSLSNQAGREITESNTDVSSLTMAGVYNQVDNSGRTLVRFGSAPIEELQAETERDGW